MNQHGQDGRRPRAGTTGADLVRALQWLLNERMFADVLLHGNVKWTPLALVRLAVFWVWSPESSLVEAANEAIGHVSKLFGAVAVGSYQALTAALIRYTPQLLPLLWRRMQQLMPGCNKAGWRVGLWLPLGVDGSRLGVPRTRPNEARFCKFRKRRRRKKSRGQKRTRQAQYQRRPGQRRCKSHYDPQPVGPQMWLTLMWHLGMRLPWRWKVGPSYASERAHVQELLQEQEFPEKTLFCGDAGFVGFDFWRSIVAHGQQFLMRVGSNVRLLKKLGLVREHDGIVYCWPHAAMKKKQAPLILRLFRFHDGHGEVFLVTSVIDGSTLTATQASVIYRLRWGIELQFRSLKQTYGRTKLRSRTPEHAEIELHWSLMGLTMLQLLALKEQSRAGAPPAKTSIAEVLRVVRSLINGPSETRPASQALAERLRRATIDTYKRHGQKQSRNYPRRKEEPCTGKPCITTATAEQRARLQDITVCAQAA